MNYSDGDGGRPPSWAQEQGGCIVGVLLTAILELAEPGESVS